MITKLSLMLAPFSPYLADLIYTNLTSEVSVHLADWPKADKKILDPELEAHMLKARDVVEKVHSQRKALSLKLRQPLAAMTVSGKSFGKTNLHQVILDEVNVKAIKFSGQGKDLTVELDTKLTPELKAEGEARDIIRLIQEQRKNLGTKLDQMVDVQLPDWPEAFEEYIKKKTLARSLKHGPALKVWTVS